MTEAAEMALWLNTLHVLAEDLQGHDLVSNTPGVASQPFVMLVLGI